MKVDIKDSIGGWEHPNNKKNHIPDLLQMGGGVSASCLAVRIQQSTEAPST